MTPVKTVKSQPKTESNVEPHRKQKKRKTFDVLPVKMDLTPMIDVVFLLLVFFLCATRFKTIEDKMSANMPQKDGIEPTMPPTPDTPSIHIGVIDSDISAKYSADFDVRSNRQATYFVNGTHRISDSSDMLTILKAMPQDAYVRIYPQQASDTEIPFGQIVRLMDLCYMSGKTDIRFMAK